MSMTLFYGLLIPFLGTALGSACVFLLKDELPSKIQKALLGFASGVMTAASVWSLLIPSMEMSEGMGKFSFVPAVVGLGLGFAFLLLLDEITPHFHLDADAPEGPKSNLGKSTMLLLAITLHNVPEGMAIGVAFAGAISGDTGISMTGAFTLAVGIAIQNFPEGAIVSMPLKSSGLGKTRSFIYGTLTGAVEPVAAFITILLTSIMLPILPYLLAFAAGAMLYVVIEELIPEASKGSHTNIATIGFAVGFILMMVLDNTLG